jgi:hypothetical protein
MFASQGIVQNAVMTYAGWSLRDGEVPTEPKDRRSINCRKLERKSICELSPAKDRSSFKICIVDLNFIFLPSHFSAISSFFSVLMAEKCEGRKIGINRKGLPPL